MVSITGSHFPDCLSFRAVTVRAWKALRLPKAWALATGQEETIVKGFMDC